MYVYMYMYCLREKFYSIVFDESGGFPEWRMHSSAVW